MKMRPSVNIALVLLGIGMLALVLYYTAAPFQQISDAPVFDDTDNTMRYIGALFGRRI